MSFQKGPKKREDSLRTRGDGLPNQLRSPWADGTAFQRAGRCPEPNLLQSQPCLRKVRRARAWGREQPFGGRSSVDQGASNSLHEPCGCQGIFARRGRGARRAAPGALRGRGMRAGPTWKRVRWDSRTRKLFVVTLQRVD
ncbi:uncharacterized protein WM294_009361 [Sarcoramphus papa]